MLTESEAKTRWCPFTDTGLVDRSKPRGDPGFAPGNACIASQCMAWRMAVQPNPDFPLSGPLMVWDREHGYCGLAGRPS